MDNDFILVLDLGGVHSALAGSVNFATGIIKGVDDAGNTTTKTLRQVFESNFRTRYLADHPGASDEAVNAAVNEHLAEYFDEGSTIFKDYSYHHMKIYYMERGAGASNLHMRFNLSYITPGNVLLSKKVTGTDSIDLGYMKYPYRIYYKTSENGEEIQLKDEGGEVYVTYQNSTREVEYIDSYTPPGYIPPADPTGLDLPPYQGVYLISPDEVAEIHFPDNAIQYKIIECGISDDVYKTVKINGNIVSGHHIAGTANRKNYYESDWASVLDRPTIRFENEIDPEKLK